MAAVGPDLPGLSRALHYCDQWHSGFKDQVHWLTDHQMMRGTRARRCVCVRVRVCGQIKNNELPPHPHHTQVVATLLSTLCCAS